MRDRVCLFIDGSNFYYQLKELKKSVKIDYFYLSNALTGPDRKLIRTYYYVCPPADEDHESFHDQQKFFSYLKNTPCMQLQIGSLDFRGNRHVEKGIDVMIAVDIVSLAYANAYDTAILISNDADLVPAIEKIKPLGKHAEYAYVSQKTVQLVESSDRIIQIESKMFGGTKK